MTTPYPLPPLPPRDASGHKGSFGSVLLVGGSRGMSGAIVLAGLTALRGGCGLTFLACPRGIQPIVASAEPSYLTIPLPEDDAGKLTAAAIPALADGIDRATAIGLGPGLGQGVELDRLVSHLYRELPHPLVVDADALNALSRQPEILADCAGPRILTPHPGEMARLLGTTTRDVQENREVIAREFALENQCVLLLKGRETLVTDGTGLYVNPTGNQGLATGGTGDVLTGLLTSLLAQGMSPVAAAQMAAFIHGHAADLAVEQLGTRGLIASDLPRYIALALKEYE
ncbi:MAG: NAD(P)H-hydrate dehydratase [Planctomycetaceae bacterium]|nr:NAD(P)H-hydrate dehydratase [Planctomycetaceae bacterium]